jgi:RNA polymerase sigma factor (sigma-70 family)
MAVEERVRFEALYRAHCGTVRSFVRRRAAADVADDVVADVFLIAWRRLSDAPVSDELPWLLGIARGTLANLRRSNARRVALEDRIRRHPQDVLNPGQGFEGVEPRVAQALRSLSERDRELLLLVAWDGLEREQAARVVGVSASAFAVRLHRARRRFARALAAEDARHEHASDQARVTEVSWDER